MTCSSGKICRPPLDNPALQKARDVLEVMNFKPEEREAYDEREKWFMVEANALKKQFDDGKEEGLEEGLKEGEKRGIKKTALSMLKEGLDAELISKITGLSVAAIRNLLSDGNSH